MFKFGENRDSFSKSLDETRIEEAMQSLKKLFGENGLANCSFLDIGSGSGPFSSAAARLGAHPVIFLAKWPVTFRNPLEMQIVDWLDGYSHEYASIHEMRARLQNMGFEIVKVFPARVPTGCNEFISRKTS